MIRREFTGVGVHRMSTRRRMYDFEVPPEPEVEVQTVEDEDEDPEPNDDPETAPAAAAEIAHKPEPDPVGRPPLPGAPDPRAAQIKGQVVIQDGATRPNPALLARLARGKVER